MNARAALGRYGERVAARLLTESGMTVLERNWRCADGEIDIVAQDGDTIVVCEVKTRSAGRLSVPCQHPMEAVGERKAQRLRLLAERWLAERWLAEHAAPPSGGVRIDLVGVVRGRRGPARVEHVRGVV
mgnify:CR=1 FL=1